MIHFSRSATEHLSRRVSVTVYNFSRSQCRFSAPGCNQVPIRTNKISSEKKSETQSVRCIFRRAFAVTTAQRGVRRRLRDTVLIASMARKCICRCDGNFQEVPRQPIRCVARVKYYLGKNCGSRTPAFVFIRATSRRGREKEIDR